MHLTNSTCTPTNIHFGPNNPPKNCMCASVAARDSCHLRWLSLMFICWSYSEIETSWPQTNSRISSVIYHVVDSIYAFFFHLPPNLKFFLKWLTLKHWSVRRSKRGNRDKIFGSMHEVVQTRREEKYEQFYLCKCNNFSPSLFCQKIWVESISNGIQINVSILFFVGWT